MTGGSHRPFEGTNSLLGYLLDEDRLFGRIEFTREHHMLSREVPNGVRIFYNPDSLIIVCYKDGPLGFPFWVPDRSTSTPAFLHTIRATWLHVLGSATLITDPTGAGCNPLLSWHWTEHDETANEQQNKNSPALDHPLLLPAPLHLPSLRKAYDEPQLRNSAIQVALWLCLTKAQTGDVISDVR
jgi:hypothetical protein